MLAQSTFLCYVIAICVRHPNHATKADGVLGRDSKASTGDRMDIDG